MTMKSIFVDYRRGLEEDVGDQIPKLCNSVELVEVPVESTVDHKKMQSCQLRVIHVVQSLNKFIAITMGFCFLSIYLELFRFLILILDLY